MKVETTMLEFFDAHTVPILASLCLLIIGVLLWKMRGRLSLSVGKTVLLTLLYVVFGLLSMVLLPVIHNKEFHFPPSLAHQGLFFFVPIFSYLVSKLSKNNWLSVLDVLTAPLPFVVAATRFYCISIGCCSGRSFFNFGFNWPTRELAIILNIVFGVCLYIKNNKQHITGIIFPLYCMLYAILNFAEVTLWENTLRDADFYHRGLTLIIFICGGVLYYVVEKRYEKESSR